MNNKQSFLQTPPRWVYLSGRRCSGLYQCVFPYSSHVSDIVQQRRQSKWKARNEISQFVFARAPAGSHYSFISISFCFTNAPQTDVVGFRPKLTTNTCMTYEMSAAALIKHLCLDGYLTSDSDLSVIIWPWRIRGGGRGKDHSLGSFMDHRGTLGLLSVRPILTQNETFYFPNLVK